MKLLLLFLPSNQVYFPILLGAPPDEQSVTPHFPFICKKLPQTHHKINYTPGVPGPPPRYPKSELEMTRPVGQRVISLLSNRPFRLMELVNGKHSPIPSFFFPPVVSSETSAEVSHSQRSRTLPGPSISIPSHPGTVSLPVLYPTFDVKSVAQQLPLSSLPPPSAPSSFLAHTTPARSLLSHSWLII